MRVDGTGGDFVRAAEWKQVREFAAGVPNRDTPAVLALRGEAGAGKSTLWRAGLAAAEAAGCRPLRSEPSAAEADLPYTALSDLLTGVLPAVAAGIPSPQREALEIALLLRSAGNEPPTDRAVGVGVLSALRACLEAGPLLIAIDDAQWLDPASLDALVFALRRIAAGPVSLLLAARADAPADPLTVGAPPLPHLFRVLLPFWSLRDRLAEARPWLEQTLPGAGSLDTHAWAELLWTGAATALDMGDDRQAQASLQGLASLLEGIEDPFLRAVSEPGRVCPAGLRGR